MEILGSTYTFFAKQKVLIFIIIFYLTSFFFCLYLVKIEMHHWIWNDEKALALNKISETEFTFLGKPKMLVFIIIFNLSISAIVCILLKLKCITEFEMLRKLLHLIKLAKRSTSCFSNLKTVKQEHWCQNVRLESLTIFLLLWLLIFRKRNSRHWSTKFQVKEQCKAYWRFL
jgi:hypothetical protein